MHPGGLEATRRALALCGWPRGASVADVGCGAGATLGLLRAEGFDAVGFDVSAAMVRAAGAESGCAAFLADAASLPLPDAVLDGLVCECVLSLLPDPRPALAEFRRALKPGGGLLLADMVAAADAPTGLWNERDVSDCLREAGFAVVDTVEDPGAAKAYAAQLLWRGCGSEELARRLGPRCGGIADGRLAYRHWIATISEERAR
jgi:SAM-dependent methyltransferase